MAPTQNLSDYYVFSIVSFNNNSQKKWVGVFMVTFVYNQKTLLNYFWHKCIIVIDFAIVGEKNGQIEWINKNLTVQILHFVIFDVSYASFHFVKKGKLIKNKKIQQ